MLLVTVWCFLGKLVQESKISLQKLEIQNALLTSVQLMIKIKKKQIMHAAKATAAVKTC